MSGLIRKMFNFEKMQRRTAHGKVLPCVFILIVFAMLLQTAYPIEAAVVGPQAPSRQPQQQPQQPSAPYNLNVPAAPSTSVPYQQGGQPMPFTMNGMVDLNAQTDADGLTSTDIAAINEYFDQMLGIPIIEDPTKPITSIPTRITEATDNPTQALLRLLPRYGMSFFRQPASTYAPVDSAPVTTGYVLGPEDELMITLWGMVEGNFDVRINRDGMANVPHVGSVRLAGYTLDEAKRVLQSAFDQYFTNYSLSVSMGELRSVTVYVTGDVRRPGAYTVSSFATLVNALLASGGPSESGSLRRIELKRGGKTITVFDMYDLLLKGDKTKDARLLPEDVIFVPPVGPLVGLAGEVRRPGVYELNGTTQVQDLLFLAGGISRQTFKGRIQYFQIQNQHYRSVFEGAVDELAGRVMQDGDVLRLFPVLDIPTTVQVGGPVGRPGVYGVVPGVTRVNELVAQAGGLLTMASNRAELTRITPTLNGPVTTRFPIDLTAAMQGDQSNNLVLQRDDYLLVHIIPEWELQRMVEVTGEVMYPGTYAVIKGERLSDLIKRCGGYTARASVKGAVFTRRRVAEDQRRELNRVADQLERDLMEAGSDSAAAEGVAQGALAEEHKRRRELVDRLRNIDMPGRVIVKLDVPDVLAGTQWDVKLEDGDTLRIPQISSTVEVMGAVYASSSHVYNPRMGINDYINAAGGYLRSAHKRMIYLLKSDGTVVRLTRDTSAFSSKKWTPPKGFSAVIEPGDTIVAPVKYSSRQSAEALQNSIDIIYKIAVAIGVLIK